MLVDIRNKLHGWFSYALVALIAVVFVFFGISTYLVTNPEQASVAQVNGEGIPYSAYRMAYQQMLYAQQSFLQQNNLDIDIDDQLIKKQVIDNLVEQKLQLLAAVNSGFGVSKQQVDAQILSVPQFYDQGKFSPALFERYAANMAYTPTGLRDKFRENMLLAQLPTGLNVSAFITKNEADKLFALAQQKRDVGYAVINADRYLDEVQPSPAQLQAYYEANKQQFVEDEQVQISYVLLAKAEIERSIELSEQQLQDYYDAHLSSYKTPRYLRVSHILLDKSTKDLAAKKLAVEKALAEHADFANLVTQYSDDLSTKLKAGDIGWMSWPTDKEQQNDPMTQAIFSLKNVGDTSGAVETKYGIQFVKITEVKPEKVKPFVEVKDSIHQRLLAEQAQKKLYEYQENMDALAYENADNLDVIADEYQLAIKSSAAFSRAGGKDSLTKSEKIIHAAFSEEVLLDGTNSKVITLDNGDLVVLRLKKHTPKRVLAFDEVTDKVQALVRAELSKEQARLAGEKLLAAIAQDNAAQEKVSKLGLSWKRLAELTRQSPEVEQELRKAIFKMPKPVENVAELNGFSLANGDYAVVQLKAVYDAKRTEETGKTAAQQLKFFDAQLKQLMGMLDFKSYTNAEKETAQIQINQENIMAQ